MKNKDCEIKEEAQAFIIVKVGKNIGYLYRFTRDLPIIVKGPRDSFYRFAVYSKEKDFIVGFGETLGSARKEFYRCFSDYWWLYGKPSLLLDSKQKKIKKWFEKLCPQQPVLWDTRNEYQS